MEFHFPIFSATPGKVGRLCLSRCPCAPSRIPPNLSLAWDRRNSAAGSAAAVTSVSSGRANPAGAVWPISSIAARTSGHWFSQTPSFGSTNPCVPFYGYGDARGEFCACTQSDATAKGRLLTAHGAGLPALKLASNAVFPDRQGAFMRLCPMLDVTSENSTICGECVRAMGPLEWAGKVQEGCTCSVAEWCPQ